MELVGWDSIKMPVGCKRVAARLVRMCKPPERTVICFDSPDVGGRKVDAKKNLELRRSDVACFSFSMVASLMSLLAR